MKHSTTQQSTMQQSTTQRSTMRRWALSVLAASVFSSFTSRSEANDPIDVEVQATPYGGTTSGQLPARAGGCAFAPSVGTTFGGLGGRVRVRRRAAASDPTRGFALTAQAAVEYQRNELLAEGSDHQRDIPANQAMAAGSVTAGYDWRYFGVHSGVILREVYGDPSLPCDPYNTTGDAGCLQRAT